MSRRRSIPWIQRWSRPITAAIATFGAIGTGYLTIAKLTDTKTACPSDGCDIVLNSNYAEVFGLPLALFGCLAYLAMAVMAIAPLLMAKSSEDGQDLRYQLENWTKWGLFLGGAAMAVFSAYLMYIMAFELKQVCLYCITSAIMSATLLVLGIVGHHWEDLGSLFFNGIIVGMVVLVSTLAVYANVNGPRADTPGKGMPPITTVSTPASVELAKYLKQSGAKMYGAFWCSHCHEQKQLFGKDAVPEIPYIECSPQGPSAPQAEVCAAAGIEGYPTWDVKGKKLSGTIPLETLAKESGYTGSMNFGTP